jgi:hypothetical protein
MVDAAHEACEAVKKDSKDYYDLLLCLQEHTASKIAHRRGRRCSHFMYAQGQYL